MGAQVVVGGARGVEGETGIEEFGKNDEVVWTDGGVSEKIGGRLVIGVAIFPLNVELDEVCSHGIDGRVSGFGFGERCVGEEDFMAAVVDIGRGANLDEAQVHGPLPPVVLASRSPRRRELLFLHGVEHRVVEAAVDDGELCARGREPRSWVMSLAYLKAHSVLVETAGLAGSVVIGADTVCVKDGEIIGQPRDAEDARAMICRLRDGEHEVLTGVALIEASSGRREIFVDRAVVRVGEIEDEEVERYVAGGEWRGKAGGYNLKERIDAGWPIVYEGDPTGVMGLPMVVLMERLRAFAFGGFERD